MSKSNKTGIFFGIIFEIAAIFLLAVVLLQFFVPAENQSPVFNTGVILYNVYGFSSILIPVFAALAGIILLCGKASVKTAVYFFCSILPFATICLAEKVAKFIYKTDGTVFASIKSGAALIICALLVAIEYILIGMLADFILTTAAKKAAQTKKEDEEEIITAFTPREADKKPEADFSEKEPEISEDAETTKKISNKSFHSPKYVPFGEQIAKKTANWKNYGSVGDYIRKNISGEIKTETPQVVQQDEPIFVDFHQMIVPDMKISEIKEKTAEESVSNDVEHVPEENTETNNYFIIKNLNEEEASHEKSLADDFINEDEAAFLLNPFDESDVEA